MRRGALILIATSTIATSAVPVAMVAPANGGTYQVIACSDNGYGPLGPHTFNVNNSWTQVPATPPTGLEALMACPAQSGTAQDGIVAQDHIPGPPDPIPGAEVFWRFAAPAGTTLTSISLNRYLGKRGDQSWRPYGRADGAIFDTCDVPSGGDTCENAGDASFAINNASTIDYGVRCDAPSGGCITGSSLHHVWSSLHSAAVTVSDPSAPALSGPSGPLWSATYTQGRNETSSWGGSDDTGISEAAWYIDGGQQTQDRNSCDYSRALPCPNMSADTPHGVNLGAFREGQHQLQAVVKDAAGNITAATKTITIDRTPPGPPGALTVTGGDASRAVNSFDVSWANPDGQSAPITRAHYRICPVFGAMACTGENTASGDNIASLNGLQVPGPGAWLLSVWLEDTAGNASSSNTATVPLHYLDGTSGGAKASAAIALAKAKLDRHHRLVVRGTAADGLTDKIAIRYRYRPHKHSKIRSITKHAHVHRRTFVAHLKLSRAARRARKGTLTVSYPGDAIHDLAKVNQRIKLHRG
jgi:hypothetical protein